MPAQPNTTLDTVEDYITDARTLLLDTIAPYRYDDASLLVALNVTQARSAFGALQRANLTGKVILIGCEQDFDVVYRVRTGDMDSVIAKDTGTMIRDAMEWIRSRREGKATTTTILVAPQLVTRSNVDSPEIQRVLAVSGGAQ